MKQESSDSKQASIEKLQKLFAEGYVINRITYPQTSNGSASIMIDLIQFTRHEECLLTVFGEEALEMSKYLKHPSATLQKGDIVE